MRILGIQLRSSVSGAERGFTIEPSQLSIFDITRYSKCKSVIWKIIWLIHLGHCWELDLACGPKFYFIWRDDGNGRYFLGSHSLVDLFWLWHPGESPGEVAKLLEFLLSCIHQAYSGIFWFLLCTCLTWAEADRLVSLRAGSQPPCCSCWLVNHRYALEDSGDFPPSLY